MREGWEQWRAHKKTLIENLVFYEASLDYNADNRAIKSLYSNSFFKSFGVSHHNCSTNLARPWPNLDVLFTRLISNTYLRGNGIVQGDRLSMASSVEMRLPLLDYRFVETVVGLRKHRSDRNLPAKHWFKESLRGLLPPWVLDRPKRGFAPPVREWYRNIFEHHGKKLIDGYLVGHSVLDGDQAIKMAAGCQSENSIMPIPFKVLVLELWCREMGL